MMRRTRRVAPKTRSARRAATATNTTRASRSRSGRTTSSTNAGCEPVSMNALSGHALVQLIHGAGTT